MKQRVSVPVDGAVMASVEELRRRAIDVSGVAPPVAAILAIALREGLRVMTAPKR